MQKMLVTMLVTVIVTLLLMLVTKYVRWTTCEASLEKMGAERLVILVFKIFIKQNQSIHKKPIF